MAEAVFERMVQEAGLSDLIEVDSAGTGAYHVGEPPHKGTQSVLSQHGIRYNGRARQITAGDYQATDYVIAMDASNEATLRRRFGDHPHLYRLLDFADKTTTRDVPDPYYEGGFDRVYDLVEDGARGLLAHIRQEEQL